MVAYLFGEVAKNFQLIHHPDRWIEYVTLSQRGDCCASIDPLRLPLREAMEGRLAWERGAAGPDLMNLWLERAGATPFDYDRGLDDDSLAGEPPPEFHRLEGSNFFRGLALIDLAEAMLKRAFGGDAVAVRVNAAGQGDYFQVHVDKQRAIRRRKGSLEPLSIAALASPRNRSSSKSFPAGAPSAYAWAAMRRSPAVDSAVGGILHRCRMTPPAEKKAKPAICHRGTRIFLRRLAGMILGNGPFR